MDPGRGNEHIVSLQLGVPTLYPTTSSRLLREALSGRQRLTAGQGPAGCIDAVLYIPTEEVFNERPFVLAGQKPHVPCDVRRTQSRNEQWL